MNNERTSTIVRSPDDTIVYGRLLGARLKSGDALILSGDLGAGKTQLAKGIAQAFAVKETVSSPTFNILKQYEGKDSNGHPIIFNHWDLYRLEQESQLEDIGFFDELDAEAINVIEWGEKFPSILLENYIQINIIVTSNPMERIIKEY